MRMGRLSLNVKRRLVVWLSHRLPACDEVTRMASDRLERNLTLRERVQFSLHLTVCGLCRRYADQVRLIQEASRRLSEHLDGIPGSLSGASRERMERLLSDRTSPEG